MDRIRDPLAGAAVAVVAAIALGAAAPSAQASCSAPANPIVAENCRAGAAESEWQIAGAGDERVQGFATGISVDRGQTVRFKIDASVSYSIDVYRLGWYGGDGARKVASSLPHTTRAQPACATDDATGLIDCGNWSESASWAVPPTATSGIYLAVLRVGGAPASHIPFVVRDDGGRSDLLFQTSDATWQAYNDYGGNDLYTGEPAGRAYKVSYNRPFVTRGNDGGEDFVFNAEYPMVRWLERNGYDVSYSTDVDTDRRGAELLGHRVFMSVGHDEYWSGQQRANVEAARNAGVSLAFFSGNESFWKTRWEDGHRTLVCYKETHAGARIDPTGVWTGTWRDPRFSPPADGGRPENALTGTIFMVNAGTAAIEVPAADGRLRFWRGTDIARQAPGAVATLADGTVGYEWDEDLDNGARPAGLVRLSSTTVDGVDLLQDYGSTYASGTATHHLTLYRDTNGAGRDALVFGAGTVQWSWGLDGDHDRGSHDPDVRMQQATANLLADMGAQPGSRQAGLLPAAPSTDRIPPTSTVTSRPAHVVAGTPATVSGVAADTGGGRVGAVEVSVDGGGTWHPADGRERWSYTWTPTTSGPLTVRSRAADDSGNLGPPPPPAPPGSMPAPAPGGTVPAGPSRSAVARIELRPRKVRMSRRGIVRLRVYCPRSAGSCRVRLRLRLRRHYVATATHTVRGGKARAFKLKLRRSARRRVVRAHSLRLTAVARVRYAKGGRATTRVPIRLLAPRRAAKTSSTTGIAPRRDAAG